MNYSEFKSNFTGLCPYSRKRWERMQSGALQHKLRKPIKKVSDKQMAKIADYRDRAFEHYGKRCVVCGRIDITGKTLNIHHRDCNRNNNSIDNIVPLCDRFSGCKAHSHIGKEGLKELEEKISNKVGV